MKLVRVQNWNEVKKIIEDCFSGDEELLEKYHIKAGTSLEECVEDTYDVLKNGSNYDFEFYKVENDQLVGFVGMEPESKYLTTFCLKKEFRTEKNKDELWGLIVSVLNEGFRCGLYQKNLRAINFLIKNGCEVVTRSEYDNKPVVILNYKKEVVCR
jgi:hypothetical protein